MSRGILPFLVLIMALLFIWSSCVGGLAAYFSLRVRHNFPYTTSLALPQIPFAEPVYQAREFQQVHHAE
jgi:hypothetical protein